MMSTPTCENCKFWRFGFEMELSRKRRIGECVAPKAQALTTSDHGCGQHQPAQPKPEGK